MANARDELKAAADRVTPLTNAHDGVADMIFETTGRGKILTSNLAMAGTRRASHFFVVFMKSGSRRFIYLFFINHYLFF